MSDGTWLVNPVRGRINRAATNLRQVSHRFTRFFGLLYTSQPLIPCIGNRWSHCANDVFRSLPLKLPGVRTTFGAKGNHLHFVLQ